MKKVLRVVTIVLVFQALVLADARARESYCGAALERCLSQCDRFPTLFREGCMMGCGIGYLNCD
jgi:hypothetical protein